MMSGEQASPNQALIENPIYTQADFLEDGYKLSTGYKCRVLYSVESSS